MGWYEGKKVFITGGSSGIGKATAKWMVASGARVGIAARGQERLEQAAEELRKAAALGGSIEAFVLDVGDPEAIAATAPEILARLDGLDILINNAGITHPGYFMDLPEQVFDDMMRVNYHGVVNLTRALLPHFIEQKSGRICNVCSILGIMGLFGYTAYAASKYALTGFSECLRQELLEHGIVVSVVYPADTDTPQLWEEDKIKPPETKALAGTIKAKSPELVAAAIASGIVAGRPHIIPDFGTRFVAFFNQHLPGLVRWWVDGDLRKFRKQLPHK